MIGITILVVVASLAIGIILGRGVERWPQPQPKKIGQCRSPHDTGLGRCDGAPDPRCGGENCTHHCNEHCGKDCRKVVQLAPGDRAKLSIAREP